MNLGPLKTSVARKTILSDDISCVNLIVVWNELAKSIKLLISALGKVHTEKMSSINLFQMRGLCGLMASSCFSMCAIKMTAKATAIFVAIAIPCVCRLCLSLNSKDISLRTIRMRSPSDCLGMGVFD